MIADPVPAIPDVPATVLPIRIVVPGAIVPWKRAQRHRLANGAVVSFTDRSVEAYHATVRYAAKRSMADRPPFAGPIELVITAIFSVPASWSKKRQAAALAGTLAKVTRPDIENSVKGALDALQSIAYGDDRQVVKLTASKVYGDRPRLEITLRPL